jgi:hypothetical protein
MTHPASPPLQPHKAAAYQSVPRLSELKTGVQTAPGFNPFIYLLPLTWRFKNQLAHQQKLEIDTILAETIDFSPSEGILF